MKFVLIALLCVAPGFATSLEVRTDARANDQIRQEIRAARAELRHQIAEMRREIRRAREEIRRERMRARREFQRDRWI